MLSVDSNLITQAITILFYVALAAFILISTMALYSLIRFSRARMMVTTITTTYLVLSVALIIIAFIQLNQIKF